MTDPFARNMGKSLSGGILCKALRENTAFEELAKERAARSGYQARL